MDSTPPESPLTLIAHRQPPANLQAEQALLGALLANNKAFGRVSDFLKPEHFADRVHGRIYEAIARRCDAGQLADAVTLNAELDRSGALEEVGGGIYLTQLLSAMVGIVNVGDYGRVIYDAWLRRQLIDLGEVVVTRAFGAEPELDGAQQVETAEQALFELAVHGGDDRKVLPLESALRLAIDMAAAAYQRAGHVAGLTTGLRDLDKKTGGLHPSDLVILAGRPGMGKTALAMKIAFEAARAVAPNRETPQSVLVFSLEMSAAQLATRILSEEARISSDAIRRGAISQREFDRLVQANRELAALPLYVDDTPALTLSALRTRARRQARTKGLALIVVDYLQLLRPPLGAKPENRVLEISLITQGLKAIAKELDVPVLALSQLSRSVEGREDKRPLLSDLRESGSIEQDADVVTFIYRDEYYLQQREPKQVGFDNDEKFHAAVEKWQRDMERVHNRAELLIEKQRHGPTGKVDLFFEGEFTRFTDLDTIHGHDGRD
jgi:replicative DNA helicase